MLVPARSAFRARVFVRHLHCDTYLYIYIYREREREREDCRKYIVEGVPFVGGSSGLVIHDPYNSIEARPRPYSNRVPKLV